jgi:putative ABC transport system ATP-binding protein
MALLEARDLRKTYRLSRHNSLYALRGVDLSVDPGELLAIQGPSGSGKTTLMHILGLLHAPNATGGPAPILRFDGTDMTGLNDRDRTRLRGRSMGFVFQSFNLVPTLTALENVVLATSYGGMAAGRGRRAAMDALASVGMAERANHRPMELSGGEQQRAALARALVNEPALLLADEPTGNLDSGRSAEVLALLRRLNLERGQTTLIVTHDPAVAARTDRVIHMRDGLVERDERTAVAKAVAA